MAGRACRGTFSTTEFTELFVFNLSRSFHAGFLRQEKKSKLLLIVYSFTKACRVPVRRFAGREVQSYFRGSSILHSSTTPSCAIHDIPLFHHSTISSFHFSFFHSTNPTTCLPREMRSYLSHGVHFFYFKGFHGACPTLIRNFFSGVYPDVNRGQS